MRIQQSLISMLNALAFITGTKFTSERCPICEWEMKSQAEIRSDFSGHQIADFLSKQTSCNKPAQVLLLYLVPYLACGSCIWGIFLEKKKRKKIIERRFVLPKKKKKKLYQILWIKILTLWYWILYFSIFLAPLKK